MELQHQWIRSLCYSFSIWNILISKVWLTEFLAVNDYKVLPQSLYWLRDSGYGTYWAWVYWQLPSSVIGQIITSLSSHWLQLLFLCGYAHILMPHPQCNNAFNAVCFNFNSCWPFFCEGFQRNIFYLEVYI